MGCQRGPEAEAGKQGAESRGARRVDAVKEKAHQSSRSTRDIEMRVSKGPCVPSAAR